MDVARSAPQLGIKKGLMVLRVKHAPTRSPTNSLYNPMDNTPLHSISSVCHPLSHRVRALNKPPAFARLSVLTWGVRTR